MQLETLSKIFRLYKQGRKNTAKALYNELPIDFRQKLLKLAAFAIKLDCKVMFHGVFDTPYGELKFDQTWLDSLLDILPEVIDGT